VQQTFIAKNVYFSVYIGFVLFFRMSEHGVIGVLCSDQQGLALSGQFLKLMFM